MPERRLIPRDPTLFKVPPKSPGVALGRDQQGKESRVQVPFFQHEVDSIVAFRADLQEIRTRQLPTISSILGKHSFPDGETFSRRGTAIRAMWETAERIERILEVNDDLDRRFGESVHRLSGSILVGLPNESPVEISVKERLRQMVDFVYTRYGKPIDVDSFLETHCVTAPLEYLAAQVPLDLVEQYKGNHAGEMLRQIRETKGLGVAEIARRMELSQKRIYQLETKPLIDPISVTEYLLVMGEINPRTEEISPLALVTIVKAREARNALSTGSGRRSILERVS